MATYAFSFQEELFSILQTCLESLSDDEQTVDSVLRSYPGLRDQLRPPLEAAAWLFTKKTVLNPRPEFITNSRSNLVKYLQIAERSANAARKIRGRKARLWISKNAVFFSFLFPLLVLIRELT
jgi:hypothetical protein